MNSFLQIITMATALFMALFHFIPLPIPLAAGDSDGPKMVITEEAEAAPEVDPQKPINDKVDELRTDFNKAKADQVKVDQIKPIRDNVEQLSKDVAEVKSTKETVSQLKQEVATIRSADKSPEIIERLNTVNEKLSAIENDQSAKSAQDKAQESIDRTDQLNSQIADLRAELEKMQSVPGEPKTEPKFSGKTEVERLHWANDFAAARAQAKELDRPVYIDFEAEKCDDCKDVRKFSYENTVVWRRLSTEFVPVWHFVKDKDINTDPLALEFKIAQYPRGAIVRPDGTWDVFVPSKNPKTFQSQLDKLIKK